MSYLQMFNPVAAALSLRGIVEAEREAWTRFRDRADESVGQRAYRLSWEAATLLTDAAQADLAAQWLSFAPASLVPNVGDRSPYSAETTPEERAWLLVVLQEAHRTMTSVRSLNPASRSTSLAHNVHEDARVAFAAAVWDAAGVELREEVAIAIADRYRSDREAEEAERRRRAEAAAREEAEAAEVKRARRAERRAIRRSR